MTLTSEDLLAISNLLDVKLKPIDNRLTNLEVHIENVTDKNIALLAENYVPAAKKYIQESARIEAMQADIEVMKSVIREHSEKLQKIS